jgi:hypothetical protein
MARITVDLPNDSEAVWLWELCKKLGYQIQAVHFGNDYPIDNHPIQMAACEVCSSSSLTANSQTAPQSSRAGTPKNHFSREETRRFIKDKAKR